MKSEEARLNKEIISLQSKLEKLPKGKLICADNGKYYKWCISNGHNKIYIPKENRIFAEQLAYKKYLSNLLDDLLYEKELIENYLNNHHLNDKKSEKIINNPEYQKLLACNFSPLSKELAEWENAPFEHNMAYPEQLIHKSSSGHLVRSKSEAMIDTLLHINKVPFRYECQLRLGDTIIYPDFTICHSQTKSIYYWEHFGMMDNPNYSKNACSKLQLYTFHNIIPSINLITTYETASNPLSSEIIEKIIDYYFL